MSKLAELLPPDLATLYHLGLAQLSVLRLPFLPHAGPRFALLCQEGTRSIRVMVGSTIEVGKGEPIQGAVETRTMHLPRWRVARLLDNITIPIDDFRRGILTTVETLPPLGALVELDYINVPSNNVAATWTEV